MERLTAAGLTLRYGGQAAFCDVSLAFPTGTLTAIVGPSGCGKTSLLTCLNRLTDLVPHARVSGRVLLDGQNVLASSVDTVALRRRVAMIFQKPNPFPLSIRRNFTLPLGEHGFARSEHDGRIEQALRDVGLWKEVRDRLDRSALRLSGGQQQRLCLARALALQPEVLLLDEPCSALDPISSSVVEETIGALRPRLTLVMVTHNLAQARRIADRVACFWWEAGCDCGRLVEVGDTEQVFEAPRSELTAAYVRGRVG